MHTIGRFAPSPSGRMHLGNVLCALLAWLSARQQNGEFLLRIEDLDEMRCPRSFADLIIDDLRWLGLDWDGEIPYQSERTAVYEKYEAILREKGLLYPCFCSRAALHAASAPHLSDGRVVYAGTCRDLTPEQVAEKRRKRAPATRVRLQRACACLSEPSRSRTACTASIPKRSPRSAATSSSGGRTACSRINWRSWWMTACPA